VRVGSEWSSERIEVFLDWNPPQNHHSADEYTKGNLARRYIDEIDRPNDVYSVDQERHESSESEDSSNGNLLYHRLHNSSLPLTITL
jgi:hypothetical protein